MEVLRAIDNFFTGIDDRFCISSEAKQTRLIINQTKGILAEVDSLRPHVSGVNWSYHSRSLREPVLAIDRFLPIFRIELSHLLSNGVEGDQPPPSVKVTFTAESAQISKGKRQLQLSYGDHSICFTFDEQNLRIGGVEAAFDNYVHVPSVLQKQVTEDPMALLSLATVLKQDLTSGRKRWTEYLTNQVTDYSDQISRMFHHDALDRVHLLALALCQSAPPGQDYLIFGGPLHHGSDGKRAIAVNLFTSLPIDSETCEAVAGYWNSTGKFVGDGLRFINWLQLKNKADSDLSHRTSISSIDEADGSQFCVNVYSFRNSKPRPARDFQYARYDSSSLLATNFHDFLQTGAIVPFQLMGGGYYFCEPDLTLLAASPHSHLGLSDTLEKAFKP